MKGLFGSRGEAEEESEERGSLESPGDEVEEDDAEEEEDFAQPPGEDGVLLGSDEDREALLGILERFRRDDLASEDDEVAAAVRMQVHQTTRVQHMCFSLLSCFLWLILRHREDQGYCLLTKKGRIISYGKGQEAQADLVWGYLERVLRNVLLLALACCLLANHLSRMDLSNQTWLGLWVLAGVVFFLLAVYTYAQRPRSDCGATYRQHFEAYNLCAATYARVDSGRHLRACCARRRTGHLRLSFGRLYPDPEVLYAGLPAGTPDVGGVMPVRQLPSATAGERAMARKDELEAEEAIRGRHKGMSARFTSALAALGVIGAIYDYLSFLVVLDIESKVCQQKVPRCHWRVHNEQWMGQQSTIEGAFPPADAANSSGCNGYGEYCDTYYQPVTYCLANEREAKVVELKLRCKDIKELRQVLRVRTVGKSMGRELVNYVAKRQMDFTSLPTATYPYERRLTLQRQMRLVVLGSEDSDWTEQLRRHERIDIEGAGRRCHDMYHGAMDFVFRRDPPWDPLFEEDCEELEEACKAMVFGPQTFAWWPPNRLLDPKYERTMCSYKAERILGYVWHELEHGVPRGSSGLTCNGEPLKKLALGAENSSRAVCRKECERLAGCRYAFHSPREAPGLQLWNGSRPGRGRHHTCLLYSSCPRVERKPRKESFKAVTCGEDCVDDNVTRCSAVQRSYWLTDSDGLLGAEGCRNACLNASAFQFRADCNAYAYYTWGQEGFYSTKVCNVYGPGNLAPPSGNWSSVPGRIRMLGVAGTAGDCFMREFPVPANRRQLDVPGRLMEYTNKRSCSGCLTRSLFKYFLLPSNLASLLTNVMTICSFLFIARVAQEAVQVGRAVFSGKPVVSLWIVEDPANREGFEARERAYNAFMSRCFEVARDLRATNEEKVMAPAVDFWEEDQPELQPERRHGVPEAVVRRVQRRSFDAYELRDALRTSLNVDKRLLGLVPGEAVRAAWSDSSRMGLGLPVLFSLLWALANVAFSLAVPESSRLVDSAGTHFLIFLAALAGGWAYYYLELRREVQGLCVITSEGRIVQLSRRPPFALCPGLRGGTCVRLDSFHVGSLRLAQLDMPAQPLLQDRCRSGRRRAWRRGVVTVRGQHGLLAVKRFHGEILTVFRGLDRMMDARRTEGLQPIGAGGGELVGICPSQDLFCPFERHIWERRLDSYGFYGDPFDYASLLSITDCRLLVTRARHPKPLSLRGMLVGPLSCGRSCGTLQEYMGTNTYLTVSSIWHEGLESYATTRTRAPPFWPGFMAPVSSISFAFLGPYMDSYPAGLFVTQRPYGIPRRVKVTEEVRLRMVEGNLRITLSRQPTAPRGHVVVEAFDAEGGGLELDDPRWLAPEGDLVEPGSTLRLEAADPEWRGYADEPWLWQLRNILDQILGRAQAHKSTWDELDDRPPPPKPKRFAKLLAAVFGGDMLGHGTRIQGSSEESDSDDAGGQDAEGEPLIKA